MFNAVAHMDLIIYIFFLLASQWGTQSRIEIGHCRLPDVDALQLPASMLLLTIAGQLKFMFRFPNTGQKVTF